MAVNSVICSIERLFDWEVPGEARLGVTLSVAWNDATQNPPNTFLLPWNWLAWNQGPELMQFYLSCINTATSGLPPKFTGPLRAEALTWNTRAISAIRQDPSYKDFATNGVGPQYARISQDRSRLGYPPKGVDSITANSAETTDDTSFAKGARWPSVLADLSTRPAPIPQVLLLSFILRSGNISDLLPPLANQQLPPPGDCSLFVAPVLPAGVVGAAALLPSMDPQNALNRDPDLVTMHWSYTDVTFEAQSQMVKLGTAPPVKSFFDMSTRLVTSPPGEAWHFSEDWQASFESRLGERLDLSAELVRILGTGSYDNTTSRSIIDGAIAALRDVAGIGCDPAPGGGTFLQSLPNFDATKLPAIRMAVASNTSLNNIAGWKQFLKTSIFGLPEQTLSDPYLAGLDIWNSGNIAPADAVMQFNRVRQKLLAPDMLWALLQAQANQVGLGSLSPPADLNMLPAALQAENLGRYWSKGLLDALASPTGAYSSDSIRIALANKLKALAVSRFTNPSFFPAVTTPIATAAGGALNSVTSAGDWKAAAVYAIPTGADTAPPIGAGEDTASLAPQGITVQINELGDNGTPRGDEVADVRKLQGAGLLLAYETATAGGGTTRSGWKCLNHADVYYTVWSTDQSGNKSRKSKPLERSVVAPLRFTWHNDVAVATVCYNSEPMAAPGPLSRAAQLVLANSNGSSEVSVNSDLLTYSYPTSDVSSDPRTLLTPLIFGRNYRPQPFLISNTGVLPKTITDGNRYFDVAAHLDSQTALGDNWQTVLYRRRKAPGPLRMGNPNDNSATLEKHLKLPAIPQGVFPRVQSTFVAGKAPKDQPVVVLAPQDDQRFTRDLPWFFDVDVRPPSTDLLTWDRFVNGFGNSQSSNRSSVINAFMTEARHRSATNTVASDMTIDDPATVALVSYDCRLYLELLDEDGTVVATGLVRFPQPSGTGLASVQSPPAHFRFSAVPGITNQPAPTISGLASGGNLTTLQPGDLIEVKVREGRIATLRLHACVPMDYAGRFADQAMATAGKLQGNYYALESTEIFIEVATDQLPDAAALYGPIQQSVTTGLSVGAFDELNGTAPVSLNLNGVNFQQYVFSAEVMRQVWRWQGLPVDPLPASGSLSDVWLTKEFGNRTDLLRSAMVPPPPDAASRRFTFTEDRGSMLSDKERAAGNIQKSNSPVTVPADSRLIGTYIRYGVQVESRYKPICVNGGYVQAKRNASRDGVPAIYAMWRDLYIPSRKVSSIKPPNIKLILPLTRNPSHPEHGPGILVLLRGPWFQECGLGEGLEAQVTLVETPEDSPTTTPQTFYYQYGGDPILSNPLRLTPLQNGQNAERGWTPANIKGPVGHTFDTVSSGQLFVNTSFVLDYPQIENNAWVPWAFCKVQLRRVVNIIGDNTQPVASSDWSTPVWVQLLPDFDRSESTTFDGLNLSYDPSSVKCQLVGKDGKPVAPKAGNGDAIFTNYIALTHFITDATGVPVQEAYDGLYRQSGVDWTQVGSGQAIAGQGTQIYYRARVITVQGKQPATAMNEEDFWDQLFTIDKGAGGDSADFVADIRRLRIVAMSRPIDMQNAPFGGC
jgi:hypothetical protein